MSVQISNNYFNSLPDEMVGLIVSFLSKEDGIKFGLTSKRTYEIAKKIVLDKVIQERAEIVKKFTVLLGGSITKEKIDQEFEAENQEVKEVARELTRIGYIYRVLTGQLDPFEKWMLFGRIDALW